MRKFSLVSAMLALVLAFGLAFMSCDDGSGTTGGNQGGTQGGGGNTSTLQWPTGFVGQWSSGNANGWPGGMLVTISNRPYFSTTNPHLYVETSSYYLPVAAFYLLAIDGKKITVRCTAANGSNSSGASTWGGAAVVGRSYILCTDYTISGSTITLIGGNVPCAGYADYEGYVSILTTLTK